MQKFFFIVLVLLGIDFFAFRPWMEWTMHNDVVNIVGFTFIFIIAGYFKSEENLLFRKELKLYLIGFVFTALSSFILFDQSIFGSLKATMPYVFAVGLYVYAHKYELPEAFIIKVITYIALFFTATEIIEQFTYPDYLFCGRIEKEGADTVEMRMGLWRMYLFGIYHVLLAFIRVYQKVIERIQIKKNTILLIIIFIGIVCFCARKDIYAAFSVIGLGLIFSRGAQSQIAKYFLGILLVAALLILPDMMLDLNEKTSREVVNEDFIRYLAAEYFLFDMSSSPLYYLFGAGIPVYQSPLGQLTEYLQEVYHIHQVDCGFIGYFSKVGIVGLSAYIMIIIKIIKNHKYVDFGLLLYLVIMFELIFFDFFGDMLRNCTATFIYLYLVECSIRRNKEQEEMLAEL